MTYNLVQYVPPIHIYMCVYTQGLQCIFLAVYYNPYKKNIGHNQKRTTLEPLGILSLCVYILICMCICIHVYIYIVCIHKM